jgi:glucokinase
MKEVVAGIDIGGSKVLLGLTDRVGNIIAEKSFRTVEYPGIDDFVTNLVLAINLLVKSDKDLKLVAVGIGAPNANYYKGTIELAPNLPWKGIVPLKKYLSDKIDIPVVITNDANAAAMGEMIFGGARNMKDFIVLTLGTGLGSGIVVNGEVIYGHSSFAGELGHTIVDPGGRECGCGRKGCLETYASASGLERTVLYMLSEKNTESLLRKFSPAEISARRISAAAEQNDPVAVAAFEYTAEWLALGIVNAVAFSSPEAVFLFGGLSKAGDVLFKPVRKFVDQNIQQIFKNTVKILPSEIPDNNAAVLGAAALAWNILKK